MRELKKEERIYAINERYNEAKIIHAELKQLEADE